MGTRGTVVLSAVATMTIALSGALPAVADVVTTEAAPAATASLDIVDCEASAPHAEPGTPEWYLRDRQNAYCGTQGKLDALTNPALAAANARTRTYDNGYRGDPFRDPTDWNGSRGRFVKVSHTGPEGEQVEGAIVLPLVPDGPRPGVMLGCHTCLLYPTGTSQQADPWMFAAQGLAEAGYVVFTPSISGNDDAVAALDFFLSTPEQPTAHGEVFPAWDELDRGRIGTLGHSGAGTDALVLANTDPRVDTVVAYDRSRSFDGVEPTVPSLFITADHLSHTPAPGLTLYEPHTSEPEMEDRHHDVDAWAAAGLDTMQIIPRASTHWDFERTSTGCLQACSRLGNRIIFYYTLAWFDRYLAGLNDGRLARNALSRLTAETFDGSANASAIGMGTFDAEAATAAGDVEAGNRPIMIEGMNVADRLSFYYPSRYYLAGTRPCDDMATGLRTGDCKPKRNPPAKSR